jgi:hypothetical protein
LNAKKPALKQASRQARARFSMGARPTRRLATSGSNPPATALAIAANGSPPAVFQRASTTQAERTVSLKR